MVKKYSLLVAVFALLTFTEASAGDGNPLLKFGRSVLNYIDSMAVKGIDPSYIGVPRNRGRSCSGEASTRRNWR